MDYLAGNVQLVIAIFDANINIVIHAIPKTVESGLNPSITINGTDNNRSPKK